MNDVSRYAPACNASTYICAGLPDQLSEMARSGRKVGLIEIEGIYFPVPHIHGQIASDIHTARQKYILAVFGFRSMLHNVFIPQMLQIASLINT